MEGYIRLTAGVLGNATSMLLYMVPIITFRRVLRKKSTEDFSGVPYILTLLNYVFYTLYGTPLISVGTENILVSTVNGVGIILECSYIFIYLLFAPPKTKRTTGIVVMSALLLFGTILVVSVFGFHSHKRKKMVVGIAAIASTILMYGSPLSVMRLVIRTKSVEFMPFYLSLFCFLTSSFWLIYGALGHDLYIMSPNFLGVPLSVVQLVLYCVYKSVPLSVVQLFYLSVFFLISLVTEE
ncbi:bidirectional sugar transporter SWEET3b-like [Cryptomeria japonica]|uniref:bidirectional sugar transporter SWEET3b-like n=1 Tax=Cryptomeria japonica TaxID=3369 RepID=UPI0027D9E285|nr:bidirectional sugar transporter SWEET3b-like [Cryptomeria japonica]